MHVMIFLRSRGDEYSTTGLRATLDQNFVEHLVVPPRVESTKDHQDVDRERSHEKRLDSANLKINFDLSNHNHSNQDAEEEVDLHDEQMERMDVSEENATVFEEASPDQQNDTENRFEINNISEASNGTDHEEKENISRPYGLEENVTDGSDSITSSEEMSFHESADNNDNIRDHLKNDFPATFSAPEDIPEELIIGFDAVLVLAGDTKTETMTPVEQQPSISTQRNLDAAATILEKRVELSLSKKGDQYGITTNLPILSISAGAKILQVIASAAYLLKTHGAIVDPKDVYIETSSVDAIGSAFYSRTIFADIVGWRRILIVVNQIHSERVESAFETIYGLDYGTQEDDKKYSLSYLVLPDIIVDEEQPQVDDPQKRGELDLQNAQVLQQQVLPHFHSLRDVWHFLTREHPLYTAESRAKRHHLV